MPTDDTPYFSNEFGAVYADRVTIYAKKGWFKAGVLEELPIRHVTSIGLETVRHVAGGLLVLGLGLAMLRLGVFVVTIPMLIESGLLFVGWPVITIHGLGKNLKKSSGGIWQKAQAEAFVAAVRKSLSDASGLNGVGS